MLRQVVERAALLCTCLVLAGCYSTSSPVFDSGERVPIAGQSTCNLMMTEAPQTETYTEHVSGWLSRDYRYMWRDNLDERSATIRMRIWGRSFGHDCDVVCRAQGQFSA